MAGKIERDADSRAAPLWLRLAFLFTLGLLLFALGGLLGAWAGSERTGRAAAAALWVALLQFPSARQRHPHGRRAAIESLAVGALLAAIMWFIV